MSSLRLRKRRAPNIVRGGRAIPLDNNGELYYLQGRSHAQGGIDIGKNPRTGIEAEGGEIVQMKPNELRVLSAQDYIGGGVSPAKQVLAGADPDKVFNEQERFKDRHRLNDDGSKYENGGDKKGPWTGQDNEKRRERLYRTVNPGSNFYSIPDWINNGILYLVNDKNSNRLKHEEFSSNPEEEEMFKSYLSDKPIYKVLPKTDVRLAKDVNPDGTYNTNKQYVGLSKRQKDSIRDNLIEDYLGSPADFISSQKGKNGWKVIDDRRYGDGYLSMLGKFSIRENNNSGIYEIMDTYDFPSWIPIPDRNKGHELVIRDTVWTKDAKPELYIDEAKIKSNFLRNVINKNKLDKEYEIKQNGGMIATINGNVKNGLITTPRFKSGGSIHIDPSKRGTFTAAAKAHGKSVQGFANQVLANKDNYSSAMVKKANFARNASKWNHKKCGGRAKADDGIRKTITDVSRGDRKNDEIWLETFGTDSDILNRARYDTENMNAMARRHADLVEASGYNPDSGKAVQYEGVGQYQQDFNSKFWDPNRRLYNQITPAGNTGDNQSGEFNDKDYMGNMTYLRTPTGLYTPETVEFWRNKGFRATNYKGFNQLENMLVPLEAPNIELNVPQSSRPDLSPIGRNTSPTGGQAQTPQDNTPRRGIRWNDDLTSLISNGLGSIGAFGADLWGANLRSWSPYLEAPVKLKTNWNINPQLDRIRESSQEAYRDIDANTASSSTALARKQRVRNQAQYAANEQWGTKENKETELINKDKLNRQGVRNRNTNRLNYWAESDANIANRRRQLRGAAWSNLFNNLNQTVQGYIGRRDQRRRDEATERMFNRAYPHGAAMARNIQSRESSGDATIPSLATNPIAVAGRLATERLNDDIIAQIKKRCGGKTKRK